jgi:hypothetical protein
MFTVTFFLFQAIAFSLTAWMSVPSLVSIFQPELRAPNFSLAEDLRDTLNG